MVPEVILLDLGGVVIQLPAMTTMMGESALDEREIRRRWLHSPSVRGLESGRLEPADFALGMVDEFEIGVTPDQFLDRFINWPGAPFPGALDLMTALSEKHHLACLSNTNALHWDRFQRELGLADYFHRCFASHSVGMLKPDAEIFVHVADALGVPPHAITFFDDNQINVDAARHAGMSAYLARGPEDVSRQLESLAP